MTWGVILLYSSKVINPVWEKEGHSSLFQIFFTFLKISPVSFGGGYALIPIIEQEIVSKKKWMDFKEISDIFSLAQSAPGAIALNSAIFIGYRLKGILGALIALIGILLPTFLIMILFSIVFLYIKDFPKVEAAFIAIRTTVLALIVYAAIKIGKEALVDLPTIALSVLTVLALYFFNQSLHPILLILTGAIVGIAIYFVRTLRGKYQIKKTSEAATDNDYSDYMI